ncbi:MAG: histone deacetylase [Gemmatimonadetes bacterium]|nr:histone deacetylase [Gemmatimonadota bacterium]NIR81158.1 histone deacetylase [Gemmatimonadota bacterium]NIT89989.1 histone deacetylase [Gemmatimonadota bacterium]NIU33796.1 histone deacetylase [Gemmatimonadota bacterium]NIU38021.1 histone deacetylase [Gemmatimonadota bacterium]
MRPTGFYLHPAAARHDTGWRHPEHQGRLRALVSRVEKEMLSFHERVVQHDAPEAVEEDLLRVHTPEHVDRVREAVERARASEEIVSLDADTRVSAASWEAAVGSAGAAIAACRDVADGEIANAFVATRPPGHHATPDRAMGFCLFNNVAVAARWLQAEGRSERVLIVDWDVHHGNGTQDVFWEDPDVFYWSLHQSPHYPGTGAAEETGSGPGAGATLNVPLRPGTSGEEYRRAFTSALDEVRGRFEPDFVLVSSGFDVLAGDPLGGQRLEPEDLHAMTRELLEWGEEAWGGRLAVLLEGGYVPERLGEGAVAVIRALAGLGAG